MLERSGRGLIRMCVCAIIWAAWRTSERSVHPQRRALWAGGRVNERLRMRTRYADGLRSPQAVHLELDHAGRDELAGCRPSRWADWTVGWVR